MPFWATCAGRHAAAPPRAASKAQRNPQNIRIVLPVPAREPAPTGEEPRPAGDALAAEALLLDGLQQLQRGGSYSSLDQGANAQLTVRKESSFESFIPAPPAPGRAPQRVLQPGCRSQTSTAYS